MNAKLAFSIALAASGCIPVHDYEGEYEMTYDVVMTLPGKQGNVVAGLADVRVREGLEHDYLIDLGPSFCHGRRQDARDVARRDGDARHGRAVRRRADRDVRGRRDAQTRRSDRRADRELVIA